MTLEARIELSQSMPRTESAVHWPKRSGEDAVRYHGYVDSLADAIIDRFFRGTTDTDEVSIIFLDVFNEQRLAYSERNAQISTMEGMLEASGIAFGDASGIQLTTESFVGRLIRDTSRQAYTYFGRDGMLRQEDI